MKKRMTVLIPIMVVMTLGFVMALTAADKPSGVTTTTFKVGGMTCGGCEAGVKIAVKKLDGVTKVKASHEKGQAIVTYDPNLVTTDQIIAAIEKVGYTAEVDATQKTCGEGATSTARFLSCC